MSIKKHTAYNLLGTVLPMGSSLVTIPIYIGMIGEARYGVLAIAWLLLGYFGLFDLGLGRATAQRIASIRSGSQAEISSTFWTALGMNGILGVIGGLIIWPVAIYFFGNFFRVDIELRSELASAIPWLVLAVPLATLSGVLTGALQGKAKFLELNIISSSSSMLTQMLPLYVVYMHGPSLRWLLPSVIFSRLLTLGVLFFRCQVHVFRRNPPKFSRTQAKDLLQFGGWVTVTSLVGPLMVTLDRFVIGATSGAKAVTHYTVPFQLAERSSILPGALISAIFPRLAAASEDEAKQLAKTAILSLSVVITPIIIVAVILIDPFLSWWLSPAFAASAGLTAKILFLGFWVNGIAGVPYALLQATGKPDVVAKCHLGELFPYLLFLYLGLRFLGLPGAAVVFGLRTLSDCVLLMWCSGTIRDGVGALKTPSMLLGAGVVIAEVLQVASITWWIASVGVIAYSLGWAWQTAPSGAKIMLSRPVNN